MTASNQQETKLSNIQPLNTFPQNGSKLPKVSNKDPKEKTKETKKSTLKAKEIADGSTGENISGSQNFYFDKDG